MTRPDNRINPKTGKRYAWEEEQARKKAEQIDYAAVDKQLALLKRQQKALEARTRFMPFIKFTSPDPEDPNDVEKSKYKNARHHDAIARAVEEVVEGNIPFLILTTAPRHGKSEIVSRRLPAWFMGRFPHLHGVVATYNDDFAMDFGKDVRGIVKTPQFRQVFPSVSLVRGGSASDRLQTTAGGQWSFVGAGGSLTGRGAHIAIVDDIIKDDKEAQSQAIRDQRWNWFTKVLMSRRMGKKLVILTFCLTGETPISMADGSWKRLDEVRAGDKVLAWRDGRQVQREVLKASSQGEDDILELRTGASTVRGNARHPFLVMRRDGPEWVTLGDIRCGDMLVTSASSNFRKAATMTEEEAWTLGFFLGDGWVTVNTKRNKNREGTGRYGPTQSYASCLAHCPKYPDRVARAIRYCEQRFGAKFKHGRFGYWRTEKAALGRWLLGFGMGAGAKGKRVPEEVWAQPAGIRDAFLAGFAAADGCVIEKVGNQAHHNGKDGYRITQILLANPDLIADLRHLARGLGYQVTNTTEARAAHQPPNSAEPQEWRNWSFRYHHAKTKRGEFHVERVRSVKPAGRAVVYDLTIDGDHNFIADGAVVHNTRWHADDPIGRLTDPENPHYNRKLAEKIKIINLPAIAEEDDPLGREPGEPLWPDGPDQFNLEFLEEQQSLDPLGFAALYQQRPSLLDGDLFKRENARFYEPGDLPEDLRFYAASDHAVGTKQRNDPSCFGKIGVDRQNNIYFLDVDWRRMPSDVAVEAMLAMAGGNMRPLLWWAEKGHISKSIGPFLRKRMLETGTYVNIREVTPAGDKAQRAQSFAARFAMGKVYFPKGAPWVEKALNEMMAFPNGLHDDFVDMCSMFGLGLQSQFGPSKTAKATRRGEQPEFGTLAWVKLADKWKAEQQARISAGGF